MAKPARPLNRWPRVPTVRPATSYANGRSFSSTTETYSDVFFISVDVTERLEIERLKSDFVSTVSYELRTPLTSIMVSLGLITGDAVVALPNRFKSMLDIAYGNGDRLICLINDILDIQKIEAGKMNYRMKPMDIMALFDATVSASDGLAREHGVAIVATDKSAFECR